MRIYPIFEKVAPSLLKWTDIKCLQKFQKIKNIGISRGYWTIENQIKGWDNKNSTIQEIAVLKTLIQSLLNLLNARVNAFRLKIALPLPQ